MKGKSESKVLAVLGVTPGLSAHELLQGLTQAVARFSPDAISFPRQGPLTHNLEHFCRNRQLCRVFQDNPQSAVSGAHCALVFEDASGRGLNIGRRAAFGGLPRDRVCLVPMKKPLRRFKGTHQDIMDIQRGNFDKFKF